MPRPPVMAALSMHPLPSIWICGFGPNHFSQKLEFAHQVLGQPKAVLNEDIGCA